MKTKEQWRQKLILIKMALSSHEISNQSRAVVRRLEKWPRFRSAQGVLFYCPLKREVQIQKLMAKALRNGKTVCVPVCGTKRSTMKAAVVQSGRALRRGPYGILQPKPSKALAVKAGILDMLFIPGLGFDLKGNRLGRGKGYYDKFLTRSSGKAIKVGLAFNEQIVGKIPVGPRDVAMDYVAFPGGILRCKTKVKK